MVETEYSRLPDMIPAAADYSRKNGACLPPGGRGRFRPGRSVLGSRANRERGWSAGDPQGALADAMITLSSGLSYFDLNFLDLPRIIASGIIHGAGGVAIVDPGPSSTLPRLRSALAAAGLSLDDVTSILVTHIHLDHAGATGKLVRERPRIRVYVHEKGAPHMAKPEKLLASATRLYGDAMDRLWGEVLPVPPAATLMLAAWACPDEATLTVQPSGPCPVHV